MPKWTEEEYEILRNNYGKTHINNIVKLLPKHKKIAIQRKANVISLKALNRSLCKKIYFFNENYFDIPNIENCYWAGFIAADGCLSDKSFGVKITISKKDKDLLHKFVEHINFTGNVRYFSRDIFDFVEIQLWVANRWHEKLGKIWNITKRKTYTLQPPNITGNLAYAFLIGFFDGDGCWRKYIVPSKYNYTKYSFSFSGTNAMMQWVKKMLNELVPEEKSINVPKRGNYYVYQACGQRAVQIREKLKQIVDIPWRLARKWEN